MLKVFSHSRYKPVLSWLDLWRVKCKQRGLCRRVTNATFGYGKVCLINLAPDEVAPKLHTGYASRAAAHEWVKDGVAGLGD